MIRAAEAAVVAIALWLSCAVFAPVGDGAGRALAALPGWPALAAAAAAAILLVGWRAPAHPLALLPLVVLILPWIGLDAGLIYAGPLVLLVWAAVLILGWGSEATKWIRRSRCTTDPRRATLAAFLIAMAWTSILAWRVAPMVPGGDEPHYLIATQSLIKDGDLRIENNHQQRDYAAYAPGELHPQYLVRGRNGAIYPVHAPGLPALAVPAFAAAGYPGVVMFLMVVMALAGALVWRIAWLATADTSAAWFGWAAVVASCTWAFQSFLVFPDALGAAAVACGLWLVLRLDGSVAGREQAPRPWTVVLAGLALALLPWLHTRFAVLAGGLGLMIVMRLYPIGLRTIAMFLAAPVVSAAAWFGFFQSVYGTPNPLAPWGGTGGNSMAWIPGGIAGLLFDQQFGLLPYAPALAAGLAGLIAGTAAGWRRATRLQIALVVVAYLAVSASYAMWWAGLSVPARLVTVLLPLLAPAAGVVWLGARNPAVRATLAAALGWTIFATASLAFAERGLFAWNQRQHKAGLWFEWAAPLLAWTEALPAFFRADDALGRESLPVPIFYGVTLVWIAAIGLGIAASVMLARVLRKRENSPVVMRAIAVTALVLALPAATVVALRAQGSDGSAPARAQMAFLARMARGNGVVFDVGERRFISSEQASRRLQVSLRAGERDGTRSFGTVPAGRYRIAATSPGADGDVLIGRGEPVATLGEGPVDITLPVDVNAVSVRGAAGRDVTLTPTGSLPRRWRQRALRAMRYGTVTAFLVDDRVYAERDGFWVGGSRFTNVVLQADPGVREAELTLRNAPVPNYVQVIGAAQPFARTLAAGETVLLPVIFDANGAARLQIDSRSGFIPAALDAGNRDERFLGVYVTVRGSK